MNNLSSQQQAIVQDLVDKMLDVIDLISETPELEEQLTDSLESTMNACITPQQKITLHKFLGA